MSKVFYVVQQKWHCVNGSKESIQWKIMNLADFDETSDEMDSDTARTFTSIDQAKRAIKKQVNDGWVGDYHVVKCEAIP